MTKPTRIINRVLISVHTSDAEGKNPAHVAIDIDKAQEILDHKDVSGEGADLLEALGVLVANHDDATKIFITPESEADPEQPTYLFKKTKKQAADQTAEQKEQQTGN